ncbi:MAG: methyltransferase domain-containing protein [Elusimicrobiota bacterium]
MKRWIKSRLPDGARARLAKAREELLEKSLRAAIEEQDLADLCRRLEEVQPDLREQYSTFEVDSEFLRTKVRGQQAFQIALASPELEARPEAVVVDVGDSSGTHTAYLKALVPGSKHRFVSVNLDPKAVGKIQSRGLEAVLARAEELEQYGVNADVFLAFELLEHLSDPATFLHELSAKTRCSRLVLSVPFVRRSRLGIHHIRAGLRKEVSAENVHIFELSPEDLRLLFRHTGWKVERERIYRQYPRGSWLAMTKHVWRDWDFEGFYGVVLSRDDTWSSLYTGWR